MTLAIKCDRCGKFEDNQPFERKTNQNGKDITPEDVRRNIKYGIVDFESKDGVYRNGGNIDLCASCRAALANFMELQTTKVDVTTVTPSNCARCLESLKEGDQVITHHKKNGETRTYHAKCLEPQ